MNTSTSTTRADISLPHPIIVLGRDDRGKAHASYFPATDAHLASKAAGLMGMLALQADNDRVRAFLPKLPKGKLFDSGKAFVPFVKQDLYKQIASHLSEGDRERAEQIRVAPTDSVAPSPNHDQSQPAKPSPLPEDFSKLKVGSLVLATEGPLEGWYEATITEIKPNETVRLKWRDYLDMPSFGRRVDQLALLHPSYSER
jgi:hypothetical protein